MSTLVKSNAAGVQETRELLCALIGAKFPEVSRVKVKKRAWYYTIRGHYRKRYLYAKAKTPARAILRFFDEIDRKVFRQPFIETFN